MRPISQSPFPPSTEAGSECDWEANESFGLWESKRVDSLFERDKQCDLDAQVG